MSKNKKKHFKLPFIIGCCPKCLETKSEGNNLLIRVYCKHNQSGAYMYLKNGEPCGKWQIETPITQEYFDALIADITQQAEKLLKAYADGIDNLILKQVGHV